MKFVAISGAWRKTNEQVKKDVQDSIGKILGRGDGIVTGGALGVDFIATETALNLDLSGRKIRVILPTPLNVYVRHFFTRASEGVITQDQASALTKQLHTLYMRNPAAIVEMGAMVCNEETYYARNSEVINSAEELYAFHVNGSGGTQDAINKAKERNIPVKIFEYEIA